MEEIARFFWKDYISVGELSSAVEELAGILSRIRGWEGIRSRSLTSKEVDSTGTVVRFRFEVIGITDEWVEERLRVTYDQGLVIVERK